MIGEYLTELFRSFAELSGFRVEYDYLGCDKESVSLRNLSGEKTVKFYCDGGKLLEREFVLTVRLKANQGSNADNGAFLERLCDRISALGESEKFLETGVGFTPVSVKTDSGPVISGDEVHSIKYDIKCRFQYLKERDDFIG